MKVETFWNIFFAVSYPLVFGLGIWVGDSDEPKTCDANEVYVVDTDTCVSEDDHGAHNGGN